MTEQSILQRIRVALCRGARRLFRNNTGQAWVGRVVSNNGRGTITLEDARPFHGGLCKGSSDLIGWTALEISPSHVGLTLAVFTAIEVKASRGRATPEQIAFIEAVRKAGGFAGIARSVEDAEAIVKHP